MDYNITYRQKDKGLQAIISYKDSNGKWKQKSKQGFKNSRTGKAKAKEWALKTLEELKTSTTLNKDYEGITFKDFFEEYLEHKRANCTLKTLEGYKLAMNHFSELNNLPIKNIKSIHIQRCVDKMLKDGVKTTSANTYYIKIKTIFESAVEDFSIISFSPCKAKIKVDKKQIIEKRALTSTDLEDLLNKMATGNCKRKYYIAALIASKCGLRVGEIAGLTWNDIDFRDKLLNVNKQWKLNSNGEYTFGELKSSNSYRVVPVPNEVASILLEYKNNNPIRFDNRIINSKSTESLKVNTYKYFKLYGYNISIHELRHTYATMLISKGLDFKTVAKLMGHEVEQTLKTYSHVTDDMMKKAKDIINAL